MPKKKPTKRKRKPSKQPKLDYINPALRPLAVSIEALIEDPKNVRTHGKKNLDAIEQALRRFGQQKPIVLDANDESIVRAGNGMLRVAHQRLKWEYIAAVAFSGDPEEAEAFALADNRTGELSEWNTVALADLLETFKTEDEGLLVGFTKADVDAIVAKAASISDGSLLKKLKVTIGEPKTEVMRGERWQLGDHLMVVADPVTEVKLWLPHLKDDMLFCPYPGPFVALSKRAERRIMLLVQPDVFIGGHIIDKYIEVCGKRQVKHVGD